MADVLAPLAGKIWQVLVEVGAKVEEDDELTALLPAAKPIAHEEVRSHDLLEVWCRSRGHCLRLLGSSSGDVALSVCASGVPEGAARSDATSSAPAG